jgi:hypothetical protein
VRRAIAARVKPAYRWALVLSAVIPVMRVASGQAAPGCARLQTRPPLSTAVFSLDGVELELSTSFLADLEFAASDPNTAIQVATAVEREPVFREFSITAAPWGLSPPTESLPRAAPEGAGRGGAEAYRAALREYRENQKGAPEEGPTVHLFGEDVTGLTSVVDIHVDGEEPSPVAITEWVAEAGGRLWIVRASRALEDDAAVRPQSASLAKAFSGTELRGADLDQPSTSLRAMQQNLPPADLDPGVPFGLRSAVPDLPFPSWWSGECDANNYYAATGVPAYPLGADYRGMKACGPRPWADYGPQVWVNFGAGVSQIEWQCPELSKRFMYLAYGIPPYSGHGSQVVWNYTGDLLEKVSNCQPGRAPEPDDVLSYGSTSTYGHTSVVATSDVDSGGNGTIGVIEQNSSSTGFSTLGVSNWCVSAGYSTVSGWLHKPDDGPEAGWLVEYYGDDHLGDACSSLYQEGTYVFGNWGSAAPAPGCPSDHFSARFSRTVDFPGGDYTFGLGYGSGARLKVDGETVVDGWGTADQHYETVQLEAGSHDVSVEYAEDEGDAYLSAFWWGPGFDLARESQDNSQWYAEYWGNQALWWDPVVQTNEGDGFLDHHWFGLAPQDGLPADHFSTRFERTVYFDAGSWRFVLAADDGVRFWIDGELIVDEWQDQVATFIQEVDLSEGDHELAVEHYENGGWAFVRLSWVWVGWHMHLPIVLRGDSWQR